MTMVSASDSYIDMSNNDIGSAHNSYIDMSNNDIRSCSQFIHRYVKL